MSRCVECLQAMDRIEAQLYLECRKCRTKVRVTKIRTIHQDGSETPGRELLPRKTIEGLPYMGEGEDE